MNKKHIDQVIREFDFSRVRKAMKSVGWKWWNPKTNKRRIPTVEEMEATVREHLNLLMKCPDPSNIRFGGFAAYKMNSSIVLVFEIERSVGILTEKFVK